MLFLRTRWASPAIRIRWYPINTQPDGERLLLTGKLPRTVQGPRQREWGRQQCSFRRWWGMGISTQLQDTRAGMRKNADIPSKSLVGAHLSSFLWKTFILGKIYKNNENTISLNCTKGLRCDHFCLAKGAHSCFRWKWTSIYPAPRLSNYFNIWSISPQPNSHPWPWQAHWFEVKPLWWGVFVVLLFEWFTILKKSSKLHIDMCIPVYNVFS